MDVRLIQATHDPVQLIADIASICYGKDSAVNPDKLVEKLYRSGHHSVLEHIYFTFLIQGISRVCSHQLVRYRMCSFTQLSQRYAELDATNSVTPDMDYGLPETKALRNGAFLGASASLVSGYHTLLGLGIVQEDARYMLPLSCCTSLYLSCNLRELIHIANERLCMRAQAEIRELVSRMVALVPGELRWMLVPKCQSGLLICHDECENKKRDSHENIPFQSGARGFD